MSYGLSRGYAIIPKAQGLEHQIENMAAAEFELSEEDVALMTKTFDERKLLYLQTFDCKYNVFA